MAWRRLGKALKPCNPGCEEEGKIQTSYEPGRNGGISSLGGDVTGVVCMAKRRPSPSGCNIQLISQPNQPFPSAPQTPSNGGGVSQAMLVVSLPE